MNFDYFVNPNTYRLFHAMVLDIAIHKNGCLCSLALEDVERSIQLDEYTPDQIEMGGALEIHSSSEQVPCSAIKHHDGGAQQSSPNLT